MLGTTPPGKKKKKRRITLKQTSAHQEAESDNSNGLDGTDSERLYFPWAAAESYADAKLQQCELIQIKNGPPNLKNDNRTHPVLMIHSLYTRPN